MREICESYSAPGRHHAALNLFLASQGEWEVDRGLLQRLADCTGLAVDVSSPDQQQNAARTLHWECARRGTLFVLDQARSFCEKNGKKLLILLSYSSGRVVDACKAKPRKDDDFVKALKKTKMAYVDVLEKHARDFKSFRLTPEEYTKRYYIGHYSPAGNHFFAFRDRGESGV